uniref:TIM barrel protein n=1 Tax=Roseihalotalea indica TaxID=2867963 RepID=A0AA49GLW3_9BACT|nr:TIM barrel protein [Tunicatimonas sp. TK19036]
MSKIKIGCETYTWQMPGEQYKGKLEHIMEITAQAGFRGIEPETSFLQHLSDPEKMQEALQKNNLELAVLCLVEDWRHSEETEEERAHADQWIEFMQHFPDALFLLVQMPRKDRSDLEERQQNLLSCVNTVARRAVDRGITCSYHPNSPAGSVYRTEEDYKILLNGLDASVIRYTPDVGHIAKGGMDPLSIIKEYKELINCVHYKDMYKNGEWAPMGKGDIDFDAISCELVSQGFEGWIILEDECDEAITDPDGVTLADGRYVENVLRPQLQ